MGAGGSRLGAGRPGWKSKTTALRHIDVRRLAREKLLRPGLLFVWQWEDCEGKQTGRIHIQTRDGGIIVSYRRGEADIRQDVKLSDSDCRYGGRRLWFTCPYCCRRVALLYIGNRLACRRCFLLAYPSQSEGAIDRLWRKHRKLDVRLNDGKRKTWATRERLLEKQTLVTTELDRLFWSRAVAQDTKLGALANQRFNIIG